MIIGKISGTITKSTINGYEILTPNKSFAESPAANKTINIDTLLISEQAKSFLDKIKEEDALEKGDRVFEQKSLYEQGLLDHVKDMDMDEDNAFDTLAKCIKIGMRISNGDNVPAKDEAFLIKNNPNMYLTSMTFRKEKEIAENHKSVLKDEKNRVEELSNQSGGQVSSEKAVVLSESVEVLEIKEGEG